METSGNWITLTTTVSKLTSYSPDQYLLKNSYQWDKQPGYNLRDATGIAAPDVLTPIQDSEYFKQTASKYDAYYNYEGTKTEYVWSAQDKTGGMGFEFNLFPDRWYDTATAESFHLRNHRGFSVYRAVWANTSQTSTSITGGYIHTEQSYSGSLGVAVNGVSLSISANISKTPATETGVSFQR